MIYFFAHIKINNKEFFNNKELLQKAKERYQKVLRKKELLNVMKIIKMILGRVQKLSKEACLKKKKN